MHHRSTPRARALIKHHGEQGHSQVYAAGNEDEPYDDRWEGPRCHARWTEVDYRAKVAAAYVTVADALTARGDAPR